MSKECRPRTLSDALDRIEELEEVLFGTNARPRLFGLSRVEWKIFALLLRYELVTVELCERAIWGGLTEVDTDANIRTHLCRMRKKLSVQIISDYAQGFYIPCEQRKWLKNLVEKSHGRKYDETDTDRCARQPGAPFVGSAGHVARNGELTGS